MLSSCLLQDLFLLFLGCCIDAEAVTCTRLRMFFILFILFLIICTFHLEKFSLLGVENYTKFIRTWFNRQNYFCLLFEDHYRRILTMDVLFTEFSTLFNMFYVCFAVKGFIEYPVFFTTCNCWGTNLYSTTLRSNQLSPASLSPQVINVYVPKFESSAAFWPLAHRFIIVALLITHITLIGLFSIKRSAASTPLLLPLPVLTLFFHWYCTDRYGPAFDQYPLQVHSTVTF